jgi:hypothetical protein
MPTTRLSTGSRNAACNAIVDQLDAGGTVVVRTGAQPATPNTAATGSILGTITLGAPAFADAANGTATAADPAGVVATADGTAGWFRVFDQSGNAVHDGSVGVAGSGADMIVATTAFTAGVTVDVVAYTFTIPV